MTKLFISYRRADSQWPADRLYETLKPLVPDPERDIFIDVDDIPLGVDFKAHLDSQVAQCDVLLALIGPSWLNARSDGDGARRLDDPDDFVRIEIASALRRGIKVVPVLLDGTTMPSANDLPDDLKPLSQRNGVEFRRLTFEADTERLTRGLGLDVPPRVRPSSTVAGPRADAGKAGELHISRKKQWNGKKMVLFWNGKKVGDLANGETLSLQLGLGEGSLVVGTKGVGVVASKSAPLQIHLDQQPRRLSLELTTLGQLKYWIDESRGSKVLDNRMTVAGLTMLVGLLATYGLILAIIFAFLG